MGNVQRARAAPSANKWSVSIIHTLFSAFLQSSVFKDKFRILFGFCLNFKRFASKVAAFL